MEGGKGGGGVGGGKWGGGQGGGGQEGEEWGQVLGGWGSNRFKRESV